MADKILQSNDGVTILKSLHIDSPAAKVLIDISEVQDEVLVLAGELLRKAEKLVKSNIHPMPIISAYRIAVNSAHRALLDWVKDNKDDAGC